MPGTGRPSGTLCRNVRLVLKPNAPAAHRLGEQVGHGRQIVGGRRSLLDAALAHRVLAQRAVADHAADVEALRHAADAVEVLAVGHPVPRQAVEDRVAGNVFDALHHRGQELAVLGLARREGDAAVAHHDAGDAVVAAAGSDRVPRQLGVEVGVDVDEARRDEPVGGIDAPCVAVPTMSGATSTM